MKKTKPGVGVAGVSFHVNDRAAEGGYRLIGVNEKDSPLGVIVKGALPAAHAG